MSKAVLKIISEAMKTLGLNYKFMEMPSPPSYPYFTGEYQESVPMYETGEQQSTFILTGWTRGTWLELEEAKEAIRNYFDKVGGVKVIADDGTAVAIFYSTAFTARTGDAELKKIQINLDVREWSVN